MAGYSSDHPGPVTLSNGIKIDIDEFPQDKFTFLCVRLDEEVGGELPYGELKVRCIEEPAMDKKFLKTKFFKITLEQEDPVDKYEIYCFVINRDWSPEDGLLTLNFVCVPNTGDGKNGEFFAKTVRKDFKREGGRPGKDEKKKLKKVIEEVWEDLGEPRFRWKTKADPPQEHFEQHRISDHEFLRRLCLIVRKKTLFCFDFEGLMIKDILDWPDRITGKPEPDRYISGYESMQPVQDKINATYNFRMYREIENPCTEGEYNYGKEISKNLRIRLHEDVFWFFHKNDDRGNWEDRHDVYKYNHRYLDGKLYNGVKVRYTENLPPLRLMDTINYAKANEQEEPDVLTYMVWSAHFFISGDQNHVDEEGKLFSATFELRGVQDHYGTFLPDKPDQDPWKN